MGIQNCLDNTFHKIKINIPLLYVLISELLLEQQIQKNIEIVQSCVKQGITKNTHTWKILQILHHVCFIP